MAKNRQPLVMRFRDGTKQHWKQAMDAPSLIQGATLYGGKYAKMACEELLAKARELVPVDTGRLWWSGLVEKAPNKTDFTAYRVSFDTRRTGSEFNYAVVAHEDPHAGEYHHKYRDSYRTINSAGDYHHFLTTPYDANKKLYTEFLRDGIREMLGDRKYNKMFGFRK